MLRPHHNKRTTIPQIHHILSTGSVKHAVLSPAKEPFQPSVFSKLLHFLQGPLARALTLTPLNGLHSVLQAPPAPLAPAMGHRSEVLIIPVPTLSPLPVSRSRQSSALSMPSRQHKDWPQQSFCAPGRGGGWYFMSIPKTIHSLGRTLQAPYLG